MTATYCDGGIHRRLGMGILCIVYTYSAKTVNSVAKKSILDI